MINGNTPNPRARSVRKVPNSGDPVTAPQDRDKAVSVALLRLLGASQEAAAEAAGAGERTVRQWETCSWWPEMLAEASRRWLAGLAAKARKGLERGVEEDGRLALKVLERLEPALAPPKVRAVVENLDFGTLTDEQLERIAAGEAPEHVLASG